MRRPLAALLIGGALVLTACAPADEDTAPTPAPSVSEEPTVTPSPTPTPVGLITVHTDAIEIDHDGAVETYALDSDGEDLLAALEGIAGDAPEASDITGPYDDDVVGRMYVWPEVTVSVMHGSVSVTFSSSAVAGVPVETADGVTVGSSRDSALAADAFGVWDEDGDGVDDYLGLSAIEVPDTRSLIRDGEVGILFTQLEVDGDEVVAILVPANDFSDI